MNMRLAGLWTGIHTSHTYKDEPGDPKPEPSDAHSASKYPAEVARGC